MAAKALPLEELKGTTVADLFAYSGTKFVEINDWINEQLDELARFPSDTFHKQGYLVHAMVEVFSKTDKKEKTKALCTLAGRLWFTHSALYEQNLDLKNEMTNMADKISDVEEELMILLTEKKVLTERVCQLQQERESELPPPDADGDEVSERYKNATRYQLITDLENKREELIVCNDQLDNLRKVYRTQVDALMDMQTQARAERRRSDGYVLQVQELEAALKNLKPLNASECDGLCKNVIKQLENNLLQANEENRHLKGQVSEEKDRYWNAENAVHDRELRIGQRENQISRLEQENELLVKRFSDSQEEMQKIRTRLAKELSRRDNSPRPATIGVATTRRGPDSTEQSDSPGPHWWGAKPKNRTESPGGGQRKRTSARPNPRSEDESDPEWTEPTRRRNKTKKSGQHSRDRSDEEIAPRASAKSIKNLRSMLPSFSKSDKNSSILEHLSLYQRLMATLEMDSELELRTYLNWTFATDSQSFFLSVDSKDYDSWAEYRSEVIKHFSPHRNAHEALRHALNLKCENNQHPRDYLQLLKNAFAQVQKEVNVETKQFKDAYFYGLPKNIRTQLARDYDDNRSIDWIYRQAKSVFDVSRTEENNEAKDKPKPSKVCELRTEKELPFETGGAKPRAVQKEKEWKKAPEKKGSDGPTKEPEAQNTVSPRYKGNNPIQNFVYKPKEKQNEARASEDREKPRENDRREREPYSRPEQEPYYPRDKEPYYPQGRDRDAQDYYRPGGYDRPEYRFERRDQGDYREWRETHPYTDNRDRYQQWDARPHSPRQPDRLNAFEVQLNDLTNHCKKLFNKDSGPSPRVHAVSNSEPSDHETPRPGQ